MRPMNKKAFILSAVFALGLLASLLVAGSAVKAAGDSWVAKAPLPIGTLGMKAVAVNGEIYAIGHNYQGTFNYVYFPSNNSWAAKDPMPNDQYDFCIANYQNKIYVMGGWVDWNDGRTYTNVITGAAQVYNIATDIWTTGASMPTPRASFQANVVNGKIYVIGGTLPGGGTANVIEV
jgi:hypothetical protein